MALTHLNITNFDKEVKESDIPVLVDFYAQWCAPCKAIEPIVEELATEYDGIAKICKLDIENGGDIPASYGVMSVPTIIMFKDGEIAEIIVGAVSKAKIKAMISKAL